MAVITTIPWGQPFTMVQSQIYSIPGDSVYQVINGAGASIDTSNDPAFGTFRTDSASQFVGARQFIRCTGSAPLILISKAG